MALPHGGAARLLVPTACNQHVLIIFDDVLHCPFHGTCIFSLSSHAVSSPFSLSWTFFSGMLQHVLNPVTLSSWNLLTCPPSYTQNAHWNSVTLLRACGLPWGPASTFFWPELAIQSSVPTSLPYSVPEPLGHTSSLGFLSKGPTSGFLAWKAVCRLLYFLIIGLIGSRAACQIRKAYVWVCLEGISTKD